MVEILVAFITGLTTGGLSCLAVQGGLLAGSFASEVEQQVQATAKRKKFGLIQAKKPIARPIILFLATKLAAYSLLGLLLGWLGSLIQLTPFGRGILQIVIGIFLVGSGLRLLNVHPVFRYFTFSPPKTLTRFIRQQSKEGDSPLTPIFLGLLTIFIPCGVTQAMMATALATSDPLTGAMLMFSFTLGTSPVFFAVSYLAIRLGNALEKYFNRFVAAILLILGLISVDTGLNLAGSPISVSRLIQNTGQSERVQIPSSGPLQPGQDVFTLDVPQDDPENNIYTITVVNDGYQPDILHVKSGKPLTLNLITSKVYSCSRAFVIPAFNIEKLLPATGKVSITIPAQSKGTTIPFSCSMGMYTGEIYFD